MGKKKNRGKSGGAGGASEPQQQRAGPSGQQPPEQQAGPAPQQPVRQQPAELQPQPQQQQPQPQQAPQQQQQRGEQAWQPKGRGGRGTQPSGASPEVAASPRPGPPPGIILSVQRPGAPFSQRPQYLPQQHQPIPQVQHAPQQRQPIPQQVQYTQQQRQPIPQQVQYTQQQRQPIPQQVPYTQQQRQSIPQQVQYAPQQPQYIPQQVQGAMVRQPPPVRQPFPQPVQQPPMQQQQPRGWGPPQLAAPQVSPHMQQQQQQQQPRGWGSPQQAVPQVSPLPSPVPSVEESSITPEQQRQPTKGGKKKHKQQQGDMEAPLEKQVPHGAVSKQQPQQRPQDSGKQRQPQQQQQRRDADKERPKEVAAVERSMERATIRKATVDVPHIEPQEKQVMRTGGTQCRKKIMVLTNHFPLSLGKLTRAIHYDVAIVPDTPKKMLRGAMEQFRLMNYKDRYPAFDGMKNLYSARPLCTNELSGKVKVKEDDREREFDITIKQVTYVDLSCLNDYFRKIGKESLEKPMQALQCIDIILRSAPSLNCIPAGRSYFNIPVGATIKLGDGTELFNGFYQSAVLGWKPFLNLDVSHKAFPMQMFVVDYINEISRYPPDPGNQLDYRTVEMFQKHMRQLKVQYELPKMPGTKRIWRVNGLGDPPNRARFTDDKGHVSTVEGYFANEKKVRLRYPNWPTLWVGSMKRESKILLPLEFCMILRGQAVNKKMTETQTRNMIKEAATSAPVRLAKIQESMAKAQYNKSPAVTEFGITVSEQPQQVQARVLEPPTLEYQGKEETVSRGVWRGARFKVGASIQSWTIICLEKRIQSALLDNLESSLINSGRKLGVNIPSAQRDRGRDFTYIEENFRNPGRWKDELIGYFKSTQYSLTVVVVPDNSKNAYAFVKQATELVVGRLTQCIKARTVTKLNPTTTDNILLKINAKLNGVNHTLSLKSQPSCFNRPIVVMGADVTHPSPDAQNIPSVAAVTCSYDTKGFRYIFSWRLQEPRLEIIQDLETIVMEHLRFYKEQNKIGPERIIFFRDGVSDGQFGEVISSELRAIRSACMRLNPTYKPAISFFVVQKRHHTRLFPVNERDSEDRNKNVPAGTCVDTVITRPSVYDFYLVSHASIQGVARPTKYVPLWDDANMTEDDIQQLTYYLCHMFARCNRSVSYPTPTYYAHLAAARAKVYIETENIDMSKLEDVQKRLKVEESIIRGLPMYFV